MKTAVLPVELSAQADTVRATVARNLDDLLAEGRWSRRAVASQLGLSHTYVNSRVAGSTDLSASDLVMFADFLSVPVSRFFDAADDDTNITTIGTRRASGGAGARRNIYLLEGVGPAGLEPTTSTV